MISEDDKCPAQMSFCVMRFSFSASKCPGYRALRAKSQPLARVWQLGHGIMWICVLSLPGAVALWWVSPDDPELHRSAAWSVVAPILLVAAVGFAMKRYAIKKGRAAGGDAL